MTLERPSRVVMVSGANRGIGHAVATLLAEQGYTLSLGIRSPSEIERIKQEFDPARTLFCQYDAASRTSPRDWVDATVNRFAKLDAIVNIAGILRRYDLTSEDEDILDELFEINVKAPMRVMRYAMPHLKASGSGRIINLASLSGIRVKGDWAGYAMSKFALMALTHSARYHGWQDGIRATAICPGYVNTDMVSSLDAMPAEDMIQPAEIAKTIQLALEMPNNASVAMIPINCVLEASV